MTKPQKELLLDCANKLMALGFEFTSDRFTDRHGDGPQMLTLAERAYRALGYDDAAERCSKRRDA